MTTFSERAGVFIEHISLTDEVTLTPHAQRTLRLREALSQLGICGSRDTILRLVRHHPLPSGPAPCIIGLDEKIASELPTAA